MHDVVLVGTSTRSPKVQRRAAVRSRRLGDLPSTREDGAFGYDLDDYYCGYDYAPV